MVSIRVEHCWLFRIAQRYDLVQIPGRVHFLRVIVGRTELESGVWSPRRRYRSNLSQPLLRRLEKGTSIGVL